MQNAGVDESQARIKTSGRNISNLRYTIDTTLMAKSKELKNLLMKVKGESEKAGLKLNIQKTKIMASSTTTSWQIAGEKMETVPYFIFLGSKITVDGASIHEIRHLFLGRKAMKKLDSVLKSKDITLPAKEHTIKDMVFPIILYQSESWTIKKVECQIIDSFELCCWRRLWRVPWTARLSNESILKQIKPDKSLEGL